MRYVVILLLLLSPTGCQMPTVKVSPQEGFLIRPCLDETWRHYGKTDTALLGVLGMYQAMFGCEPPA